MNTVSLPTIATPEFFAVNMPFPETVAALQEAQRRVAQINSDDGLEEACATAHNALFAVLHSYAATLDEAVRRVVFVDEYCREYIDSENSGRYLTQAIDGLRPFLGTQLTHG